RRNRCTGHRTDAIGCRQRLAATVLQIVEVHALLTFRGTAHDAGNLRVSGVHDLGDDLGKLFRLIVVVTRAQGHADVQAAFSGSLAIIRGAGGVEQAVDSP